MIASELTSACNNDQYLFQPVYSVENHPNDSRVGINEDGIVQALTSRMGTGGGNVPMVLMEAFQHHGYRESDVCGTLTAGQNNGVRGDTPLVCYSVDQGGGKSSVDVREDKAPTLTTTHDGAPAVCYVTSSDGDIAGTLDASYYKGTGTRMGRERTYIAYCIGNGQANDAAQIDKEVCKTLNCMVDPMKVLLEKGTRYIVRRLTPLECERLQGYPDGWTDIGEWVDTNGKKRQTSDAARYKALGNSIALPPWKWVLKRLCACYERDATMASLFDGIGGFPYLWEQINGKGTCLWASEIEEFPIAVTKVRIHNG